MKIYSYNNISQDIDYRKREDVAQKVMSIIDSYIFIRFSFNFFEFRNQRSEMFSEIRRNIRSEMFK